MADLRESVTEAVAEVAKSALSVSFGGWLKIVTEEHLKEAASDVAAGAMADMAKEVASASLGAIAGPVLKLLLRVSDRTAAGVKALIAQPLATGLREANQALAIDPASERDIMLVDERLASADAELARALSLVPKNKNSWKLSVYIQLLRALIAQRRGARAVARSEFEAILTTTRAEFARLTKLVAERQRGFEDMKVAVSRGHPGGTQAEINFYGYLKEAQRERAAVQNLNDFVSAQVASSKADVT